MKRTLLALATTAALAFSLTAIGMPNLTNRFYVGANLGYAKIKEFGKNVRNDNNHGIAWNLNVGDQFHKNFAAELGFTKYPDEIFGNDSVTAERNMAFYLAAKAIYPWQHDISFFAKLGPAYMHHTLKNAGRSTGSHRKVTLFGGAGAELAITKNVSANIQFTATAKNDKIPAMLMGSVGLAYAFA